MDKNKWISVNDKLPSFQNSNGCLESDLILLTDGNHIFVGYLFYDHNHKLDFDSFPEYEYGIFTNPTHWQELPQIEHLKNDNNSSQY